MEDSLLEQVTSWLEEGGDTTAAAMLQQCTIEQELRDEIIEFSGDGHWSLFDVRICAPRAIYDRAMQGSCPEVEAIELSIRANAQACGVVVREISWVPLLTAPKANPAAEEITHLLSSVDSPHIHRAWRKALKRKSTDPDGALTSARTLLESVCKYILETPNSPAPATSAFPTLFHDAVSTLRLAPKQHSDKLAKQVLGHIQAVVNGISEMRRDGDAHGKSPLDEAPEPALAELAVNLAGSISCFLIQVHEVKGARRES